jgi:hypothetical protein
MYVCMYICWPGAVDRFGGIMASFFVTTWRGMYICPRFGAWKSIHSIGHI